jgi:beta-N-acetylhexosaminidase
MKLNTSLPLFCAAILLAVSCNNTKSKKPVLTQEETDAVEAQLSQMSLREKVGQLFTVRPEALCPELEASGMGMYTYKLQTVTEGMVERTQIYPVGGYTLFAHNIDNPEQLKSFTAALHALPGEPLLSIDEEGGRVARIANNDHFDVPRFASMAAVGATGDPAKAQESGKAIGNYLKEYGFDIDFAPDADVNTNPENVVIGDRAFSNDPKVAAPMVVAYLKGLEEAGVEGCIKHFPGNA